MDGSQAGTGLRDRFEAAVLAEAERVGAGCFNRSAVIRPFLAGGAKQSTLYRWADAVLAAGRPARRSAMVSSGAERASAARGSSTPLPVPPAAPPPSFHSLLHVTPAGAVALLERLDDCIAAADQLMAHARTDEGKVRNARLLMAGAEQMRRCLETAARITETLIKAKKIDEFHAMMLEEVEAESPPAAERIVRRLTGTVDRVRAAQ